MSTNADHLNDLLNGLLDGVLSDEEQRTLELAMKADPSLEVKLSELQALRRSLLRGRSVGRLGPDFSKQIVASARERAEAMGDGAPEWVIPSPRPTMDRITKRMVESSDSRVNVSVSSESVLSAPSVSQRAWKVWIPMLAVATAASLVLYFAGPLSTPLQIQPLVSEWEVEPKAGSPNDAEVRDPDRIEQEINHRAMELLAQGNAPSGRPDQRPEVALPDEQATRDAPSVAMEPSEDSNIPKIAEAGLPESSSIERSMASNDSKTDKPSNPVQEMLDAKGIKNPVFTLVADIAVDPVAEQNNALRSLLEEHELLYTDDLNISSEQLDSLIESQMIGMMSGTDAAERSEDVQVLFVRAKAKRIDSFLMALSSQYKDFPRYRLDLSFDPSVVQLTSQLSSIVNNDDRVRRLTFRGKGDFGLVSAFPAGNRGGEYLDLEKRQQLGGQPRAPKLSARDELSYLILLVKKMPAAQDPE